MKKRIIIISSILICISLTIIIGFNLFKQDNKNKDESQNKTSSTTTTISTTTKNSSKNENNEENESDKTKEEIKTTKKTNTTKNKTTSKIKNTTTTVKTTTKATTKTTTTKLVDIVSVDDTFVEDGVEYKYGVKVTKLNKIRTVTYSDGTISKKQTDTKTEYEHSSYNATTQDLKIEGVSVSNKNSSIYDEMLVYVNKYRSEVGINSLEINEELNLAATIRAIEMAWADKFSHTRPNNSNCVTIYDELDISYTAWGENIAFGYTSVSSVSEGWKESPGHYKNMITDYFTKIGFGKYVLNEKTYWVQMFK